MKQVVKITIVRFAASAGVVVAVVLLYSLWVHVNPTTVGFTLLLVILSIAATWGLRYAIFAALLATMAYNYFFLPPLFRLIIADPQNWVALLAFLVTAVVASQLSERARRGMVSADKRRREVETLYSFSQQLWLSELAFNRAAADLDGFHVVILYLLYKAAVWQVNLRLGTRPESINVPGE